MNTEPMSRSPSPRQGGREAIAALRQHLAAGLNEAHYNIACDEEACQHYGETPGITFRIRCFCAGFIAGFRRSVRRKEDQA